MEFYLNSLNCSLEKHNEEQVNTWRWQDLKRISKKKLGQKHQIFFLLFSYSIILQKLFYLQTSYDLALGWGARFFKLKTGTQ